MQKSMRILPTTDLKLKLNQSKQLMLLFLSGWISLRNHCRNFVVFVIFTCFSYLEKLHRLKKIQVIFKSCVIILDSRMCRNHVYIFIFQYFILNVQAQENYSQHVDFVGSLEQCSGTQQHYFKGGVQKFYKSWFIFIIYILSLSCGHGIFEFNSLSKNA